ncbi:hypothetical protein Mp_2g20530 [Marchantia polymorpha subsp. ruderalis]|uniref:Uncharacterized protein n=1 Tax=Marchantia polymorpha TaxID=3197 RepID=A0A2R6VX94_MARPO|nr:hypothetical protein MARPO_4316s0001 [Marchantia polymorpha]BBN03078.1 hypothetical protein Mp_2g20530 [Marchantia polymorpha subsp. ruderalis]|eukprot:PTQ26227.1 hypothetical protein MARPO_4316s0001 [Marchantia polymorpha]
MGLMSAESPPRISPTRKECRLRIGGGTFTYAQADGFRLRIGTSPSAGNPPSALGIRLRGWSSYGASASRLESERSKWAIFGKQNWRCGMNRKPSYGAKLRANPDPTKGVDRLRQQDGGHGSRNPLRSV